jgi:hypothetical protein
MGGMKIKFNSFLTSARDGRGGELHNLTTFAQGQSSLVTIWQLSRSLSNCGHGDIGKKGMAMKQASS